jgi:DnaJ-class molecular chaperone
MKPKKIHTYNGKSTWFTPIGRQWHVKDGKTQVSFDNIEKMVKAYPELMNIPTIQATIKRRAEKVKYSKVKQYSTSKKNKPTKPNSQQVQKQDEMPVTCYYCSGTGKIGFGMPCTNCGGKGSYVVTTKGI